MRGLKGYLFLFPFTDRAVSDRFAEDLRRGGVQGDPGGFIHAVRENRLTGKQMQGLLFGVTVVGDWGTTRISESGDAISETGMGSDSGKVWIEGDTACQRYQKLWYGMEHCGSTFRNPGGTPPGKDEYFFLGDHAFWTGSIQR